MVTPFQERNNFRSTGTDGFCPRIAWAASKRCVCGCGWTGLHDMTLRMRTVAQPSLAEGGNVRRTSADSPRQRTFLPGTRGTEPRLHCRGRGAPRRPDRRHRTPPRSDRNAGGIFPPCRRAGPRGTLFSLPHLDANYNTRKASPGVPQ